ncbi:MAG: transglycosylase SLT domain-containing protein [Myxococcales bacterium]|nr:transglycosylase SLT domain-containing protein [Myxococcales bacterium]
MRIVLLVAVVFAGASAKAQPEPPSDDDDLALYFAGEESPALEALRRAERAMFQRSAALVQVEPAFGIPRAATSDVPSLAPEAAGRAAPWLEGLLLPDLPIRFHDQVVRYLEYFREDSRGRSLMSAWLRRSTRYGATIESELQARSLPPDLRCVAMAESGFDPTVRSHRGAVGMWQFVSRTGAEYGLRQDRWIDERMDPVASTRAAAQMLGDLQRRFGRWELALAAYNMGYGALLRAIRKYNTNDYWTLADLEAGLPFETKIYVAKIMACAVVMRNPEDFGFADVGQDVSLDARPFEVPGGTTLAQIARAADRPLEELQALNPHLRRGRVPPGPAYAVNVPAAHAETFAARWTRQRPSAPQSTSYTMRFGESLADVAYRFRTSERELAQLNAVEDGELLGAGTTLFVPAVTPRELPTPDEPPVIALPEGTFRYPDRARVFYRVAAPDRLDDIATFFRVSVDEIRRWNHIDPAATLHAGMFLQLFVPRTVNLSEALVLTERDVRLVTVGTEAFFDDHERRQGRVRFRYQVAEGDTMASIARRFGLSVGSVARINQLSHRTDLRVGQEVVIYADEARVPADVRRALGREAAAPSDRPEPAEPAEDIEGTEGTVVDGPAATLEAPGSPEATSAAEAASAGSPEAASAAGC